MSDFFKLYKKSETRESGCRCERVWCENVPDCGFNGCRDCDGFVNISTFGDEVLYCEECAKKETA